jgi:hypothetical protein
MFVTLPVMCVTKLLLAISAPAFTKPAEPVKSSQPSRWRGWKMRESTANAPIEHEICRQISHRHSIVSKRAFERSMRRALVCGDRSSARTPAWARASSRSILSKAAFERRASRRSAQAPRTFEHVEGSVRSRPRSNVTFDRRRGIATPGQDPPTSRGVPSRSTPQVSRVPALQFASVALETKGTDLAMRFCR